jgi:hypothetical protein
VLPFLSRFYDEVEDNLADPRTQKRLTSAQRYRDLLTVSHRIYERLLAATGQESGLGLSRITFPIVAGQDRYPLPSGFRNFIALEWWDRTADPPVLLSRLRSLDMYNSGPGVEVLDGQRGCLIRPCPTSTWAGNWELVYRRGAAKLHYAEAGAVTETTLVAGTPATDCGEVVKLKDYYAGCLVRIVSAANPEAAGQIRECVGSELDGSDLVLTVAPGWDPVPEATDSPDVPVVYEICPELPDHLDSLYAMDVAILNARRFRIRAELREERHELWQAARNFYTDNVSDRQPERILPPRPDAQDPWD